MTPLCAAPVLAQLIDVVDRTTTFEPDEPCPGFVAYVVTIERPAAGIGLTAEVCEKHQSDVEAAEGSVRSVKLRART